jgi:asparagine synthase (glutamine-hydrolysing)
MCGIAGFVNLDGQPASTDVVRRMMHVQRHRGPDDQGVRLFSLKHKRTIEPNCVDVSCDRPYEGAIGFNRLSVLDLSPRGHQPMTNRKETIFIAFNGEVYNAFEYVPELKAAGFEFRSRTDTEVILYLYERYGIEGMLERLNGMFAMVIVDLEQRCVHMARDHLGIKPFYWAIQNGILIFSSEVKSFLAHPSFRSELEPANLDEFLTLGYCAGNGHLLKGVFQLPPGHRLFFGADGLEVRRYWEIPDEAAKEPQRTFEEAIVHLDSLLRRSVKSQLLSDVKVGCQLSGGIDSSLVTLFARSYCDADMDAFSIVFEHPRYSEEPWISQAAMKAHVDTHRFIFTEEAFCEGLEKAAWHLDSPLNQPNCLAIYLLAQKARKLVTVLLSGEGADELFGGYPRFYYAALRQSKPWLELLRHVPGLGARLKRAFGARQQDPVGNFITARNSENLPQLFRLRPEVDFEKVIEKRRTLFGQVRGDFLQSCVKYEMQTYLADLLVRQDKMTMAHSLENRVPFLDRELVSFVRGLPMQYLIGSQLRARETTMRNTKIILKQLACRALGEEFTFRPKCGFGLPLFQYYQNPRFQQLMEDQILPGIRRRQVMQYKPVEDWWRRRHELPVSLDEVLWIPVAFELWAQRFLPRLAPN